MGHKAPKKEIPFALLFCDNPVFCCATFPEIGIVCSEGQKTFLQKYRRQYASVKNETSFHHDLNFDVIFSNGEFWSDFVIQYFQAQHATLWWQLLQIIFRWKGLTTLADLGGARPAPPPPRVQILSFWHAKFSKRSRLGGPRPPYGKSWIRHCTSTFFSI